MNYVNNVVSICMLCMCKYTLVSLARHFFLVHTPVLAVSAHLVTCTNQVHIAITN